MIFIDILNFRNYTVEIGGFRSKLVSGVKTDPKAGYKGFTAFIVDTKLKGFTVAKKLDKVGWRSSDTTELDFEDLEVDEEFILGKVGEGWTQASLNLNWERLMLLLPH